MSDKSTLGPPHPSAAIMTTKAKWATPWGGNPNNYQTLTQSPVNPFSQSLLTIAMQNRLVFLTPRSQSEIRFFDTFR